MRHHLTPWIPWAPWIATAIIVPLFAWLLKALISDWHAKKLQLEEYKEKSTQALLNEIKTQVEKVVSGMEILSSGMGALREQMHIYAVQIKQNEVTIGEVGERIRKNVLDNRNVSRNIKDEVVEIVKRELPIALKGALREHGS